MARAVLLVILVRVLCLVADLRREFSNVSPEAKPLLKRLVQRVGKAGEVRSDPVFEDARGPNVQEGELVDQAQPEMPGGERDLRPLPLDGAGGVVGVDGGDADVGDGRQISRRGVDGAHEVCAAGTGASAPSTGVTQAALVCCQSRSRTFSWWRTRTSRTSERRGSSRRRARRTGL